MSATGARGWLFRALALCSPLVLFALLELVLRVVGFGGSHPLFVDFEPMPGMRMAGPDVMKRYVPTGGDAITRIDPFLFHEHKPEDGLRIVVQGGSSAAGFPYGRWGGLAGMLNDRFEALVPERDVEVISTAMAAVNTYTLVDLMDEIVAIEPDAVLVYAGHNEYLGVLGVGSALGSVGPGVPPGLQIALGRFRVYQLAARTIGLLRGLGAGAEADRNTIFASAAAGARIGLDSDPYRTGLARFEANLRELLMGYSRAGIPVFVGTLVSNERDLAPFVGGPGEPVDAAEWERLRRALQAARVEGRLDDAGALAEELIALDPGAATAWFEAARVEWAAGRTEAAREAFVRARDLDRLRFRAPSAFEEVIRRVAAEYGATVVEVEARFVARSEGGIPGDALLLEHVHPNAAGYRVLADAFFEALVASGVTDRLGPRAKLLAGYDDTPLTSLDLLLADYDVQTLKAGFPFSDPPRTVKLPPPRSELERVAQARQRGELEWIEAMDAVLAFHRRRGELAEASRVARQAAHEHPADRGPNLVAAMLLLESGQPARARRYAERSLLAAPDDPVTLELLLRIARATGDRAAAGRYRERLAETAPERDGAAAP